MIAASLGETPRDWVYARGQYGMDNAFQGICSELLATARGRDTLPSLFDAILIDEAQDLPPEFFQLVYSVTADPKRVVFAQRAAAPLGDGDAHRRGALRAWSARRDTRKPRLPSGRSAARHRSAHLLPKHAMGARDRPRRRHRRIPRRWPTPASDEPAIWVEIGYNIVHGELAAGEQVTLRRGSHSYPDYFPRLLEPADAVAAYGFADEAEQDEWVARAIAENVGTDKLDADDILIVLPESRTARRRAASLIKLLGSRGISAHLVGVTSSGDALLQPGSVAIAHIHRAKGNEAPMVYAMDSHLATRRSTEVTRRNTLFTAITRSRAWVRVVGWGPDMTALLTELEHVVGVHAHVFYSDPRRACEPAPYPPRAGH